MKKPVPALIPFLVFVSMVFIGILIFAYIETKKANPQMIETTQASLSTRRRGERGDIAEENVATSTRPRARRCQLSPRHLSALRASALKPIPQARRA